jgi:hypothetical protein
MAAIPTSTPAAFVDRTITLLKALTITGGAGNGKKYFQRVGRMADVSIERLRRIPAFPACVVTQLDGELEKLNGSIWNKSVGITVIDVCTEDAFTDRISKWLDDASDKIIGAMQERRESGTIQCVFESGEAVISDDGQRDFVMKTLVFAYSIDRTL